MSGKKHPGHFWS